MLSDWKTGYQEYRSPSSEPLEVIVLGRPRRSALAWGTARTIPLPLMRVDAKATADWRMVQSLFAMASNSKLCTVLAIGMLIEDKIRLPDGGVLSWDTRVKDVLPEFELVDNVLEQEVTLEDFMSECKPGWRSIHI